MTEVAKNYDVLCYHLKVIRGELNSTGRDKIDFFLEVIRHDLLDNTISLPDAIDKKFPLIFDLRVAALKWFSSEGININEVISSEVYPFFEQLMMVDRLATLAENILFALRCNKKVAGVLMSTVKFEKLSGNLPESFDQLLTSIRHNASTEEIATTLIEWAKCSLRIEYIICAASSIFDDKLMVAPQRISELSSLVVNAAQTYSALALEMGVLPSNKKMVDYSEAIDATILKEQQQLAEEGTRLSSKDWDN